MQSSVQAAAAASHGQRGPRTAAVVQPNRRLGPIDGLQIAKRRAPDGFANRDDIVGPQELLRIATADKDKAEFNTEFSTTVRHYRSLAEVPADLTRITAAQQLSRRFSSGHDLLISIPLNDT